MKRSLFRWLEDREIEPRFDLSDGYVTLSFTGDGERLRSVWVELRRIGYTPNSRPEKGATTYHAFWEHPGEYAKIFMHFSSSVCKRVQIGTEMKEVPIYETQCGELPALELLETAPVISAAPSEEIPF